MSLAARRSKLKKRHVETCRFLLVKVIRVEPRFRFKSTLRYLYPSTLLRVFAPKGARDFRHENAKTGLSPKEIQYLSGHATPDLTMRVYAHFDRAGQFAETAERIRALG